MKNQKVCCLYISTFHLFTIILPYINEKIKEGKKVKLLLQKDLSVDLKLYVKNVNSLKINIDEIINLGWDKKSELFEKGEKEGYLIVGDERFVLNNEKILIENDVKDEIISCFRMNTKLEISKILLSHDELLTTKTKREINKFSQNEQKTKTIQS